MDLSPTPLDPQPGRRRPGDADHEIPDQRQTEHPDDGVTHRPHLGGLAEVGRVGEPHDAGGRRADFGVDDLADALQRPEDDAERVCDQEPDERLLEQQRRDAYACGRVTGGRGGDLSWYSGFGRWRAQGAELR